MLTPTDLAYGAGAKSLMQSMLEQIEDRRKEEDEKRLGKPKNDPMVEARISASEEAKRAREKIASALFDQGQVDINELRMDLVERLGKKLGIDVEDAKSSYSLGKTFEAIVKDLGSTAKRDLEKEIGLDKLDISLDTFVAAITNPYGKESDGLKDALEKKAGNGRSSLGDARKVIQRLEDVANPKTLAELKLGPQYSDPTRVVDEETKAETLQDIRNAEAAQKLDEVLKTQDAVKAVNDVAFKTGDAAKPDAVPAVGDGELLQVLAAAVEQGKTPQNDNSAPSDAAADVPQDGPPLQAGDALPGTQAQARLDETMKEQDVQQAAILPVSVDEIGLYSLLKKRLAA